MIVYLITEFGQNCAGHGFASEFLDIGGLQVYQTSEFSRIWATYEGGPEDLGATFFEPSHIPSDFFMLGCYCQPNNQPFFGWVLVAKDLSGGNLARPNDYTLVWSSDSLKIKQDGLGYIWLPVAPDGYKSVGYVVTNTPEKPSTDKIRCVVSTLTDELEHENWIWGQSKTRNDDALGFEVFNSRPRIRGVQAQGVPVGTFIVRTNGHDFSSGISCLRNNNFITLSYLPNLKQIEALFEVYSPLIYFHPNENHMPSSVNWYFQQGTLLYSKEEESKPVPIETDGANLPQGGSNDGAYWIDLPLDDNAKVEIKKGDLASTKVYLHIKPMLGATFTDIVVWIFYPFNGPGTAKIGLADIPLGRIGEHIGDWEHLTLRISNFNGVLHKIYLSQHSKGSWIDASLLEFQNDSNKPVVYSAKDGHPLYHKPGLVLQGSGGIGIRNDTAISDKFLDTREKFCIVSAEYLRGDEAIVEPPWLNYTRKWGPKITYSRGLETENLKDSLHKKMRSPFERVVKSLPNEFYGEDGPTGPNVKDCWNGDER